MTRDDQFDMAEDDDDEPILNDEELARFEKSLFAAMREAHKLDTEIDDEYRRLTNGEYDEGGPTESPG